MIEFMKILESIGTFIQYNWITLCWLILIIYIIKTLKKNEGARKWLAEQIEWAKLFFADDDDDTVSDGPSHKNLALLGLIFVFMVAFLKKVAVTNEIPDIPSGWQLVILAGIGITTAKSAAQKFFDGKYSSSKTEEDKPSTTPPGK